MENMGLLKGDLRTLPFRNVLHHNIHAKHRAVASLQRIIVRKPVTEIAGIGRRLPFHIDVHRRLTLVHHPPEHRLESIGQRWGQHFSEGAPNIGVDRKAVDVGKGLVDADKPQIPIDERQTSGARLVEAV